MKISLNMGQEADQGRLAQLKALERDIVAAGGGDWTAKTNLARHFAPLLTSLAHKRSQDTAVINRCLEAGREGLFQAARKYKPSVGPDRFQIFAVDFIESAMDRALQAASGRPRGFLARLFGK